VSTATLRKWESRYGFPRARRARNGRRVYDAELVEQLRQAKALIDGGKRAGLVLTALCSEAEPASDDRRHHASGVGNDEVTAMLALLREHDLDRCRTRLRALLERNDAVTVVDEVLTPLMAQVGEDWYRGELEIFQEHAITALLDASLGLVAARANIDAPLVVLAPAPGDHHSLGLRLLELALTGVGARCLRLGAALPVGQLAAAARSYRASVVGVGVSEGAQSRSIREYLELLVANVPPQTSIWVGGRGVPALHTLPPGTRYLDSARRAAEVFEREILGQRKPSVATTS
jgi:methanogenic corrinoid protein MtbC1